MIASHYPNTNIPKEMGKRKKVTAALRHNSNAWVTALITETAGFWLVRSETMVLLLIITCWLSSLSYQADVKIPESWWSSARKLVPQHERNHTEVFIFRGEIKEIDNCTSLLWAAADSECFVLSVSLSFSTVTNGCIMSPSFSLE